MSDTRTLSGAPSASTLYPRAVAGSYALPLLRGLPVVGPKAPRGLPDLAFALDDVALDAGHVADYARVCGFSLRDAVPPTYLHILAFPLAMRLMTDSTFPFGVLGLVHVENRIDHLRPVSASERVAFRVHAEDLRDHPRGKQFDVVAVATVDGERVWEGRSTYLRRGATTPAPEALGESAGGKDQHNDAAPPAAGREGAAPPAGDDAGREGAAPSAAGKDKHKDVAPPAAEAVWKVPADIGRRYGAVSGDRNPIHLHNLSAKVFGMPRAIAHGMWLKARTLAALEAELPAGFVVDVRFKLPVLLPATVGLSTTKTADGRAFAVHDAKKGLPHLDGAFRGVATS